MKNPRFLILLAVMAPCFAEAVTLSQWTFNSQTTASSGRPPGVDAGDFGTTGTFNGTIGPVATSTVVGVGGTSPYVFGIATLPSSEEASVTANKLHTFTVTPTTGNMISFSELSFYSWANSGFNAESYSIFVRSSQTGTTTLDTFTSTIKLANTGAGSTPTTTSKFTIDLSAFAELQNVTTETTFTIGVYVNNPPNSPTALTGNLRFDSIDLQGTVSPVPEPASLALLSVGVLGFVGRRRR